jgi:hypothetical protein
VKPVSVAQKMGFNYNLGTLYPELSSVVRTMKWLLWVLVKGIHEVLWTILDIKSLSKQRLLMHPQCYRSILLFIRMIRVSDWFHVEGERPQKLFDEIVASYFESRVASDGTEIHDSSTPTNDSNTKPLQPVKIRKRKTKDSHAWWGVCDWYVIHIVIDKLRRGNYLSLRSSASKHAIRCKMIHRNATN